MKSIRRSALAFFVVVFIVGSAVVALADPPGRVARIDYMTGGVSVQPGGVKDWVEAELNRPLTSADRVWTDKDSRAELHLGTAYMRMSSETSVTLTNLSDQTVQIELDQGTLNLRIRHLYSGEIYEIDTPNLAFTVTKSGEYRFDVDPNGDATAVTVRKGEGEATGEGRAVKVRGGEQARFTGGTSLSHNLQGVPEPDGFDDWCRVRDKRQESYASYRYVSPDVIGADDLDDYGTWRTVPSYGAVWVPAVAPGWAPYRYGHWIWVDPWGWTWVDDAPWGFAPCHYGRWVHYGGYWGWAPGPVIVRPVYAPALVAWVGGEHWGVGVSFGGPRVGWFPLGYGEPYVPPYYVSRNYFHNVNVNNTRITNVTNITNIYNNTYNNTNTRNSFNNTDNSTNINGNRNKVVIKYANREIPGAVTAVPRNVMSNSQPVQRAALRLSDNDMRGAPLAMAPPVAPSKSSVLGGGHPSPLPPAHIQQRGVVSRLTPPPAPLPFSAKQEALSARPGRPLDAATERQLRGNIGNGRGPVRDVPERSISDLQSSRPGAAPGKAIAPARNVPQPPERTMNGRGGHQPDTADRTMAGPNDRGTSANQNSNNTGRTVPRPPDRTYVGRQPGSSPTEMQIPRASEAGMRPSSPNVTPRTVPRPPDRAAREASVPRQADMGADNLRQNSAGAPVRNVPRPPESTDRGTMQQNERSYDRPASRNMPTPATVDRPANMDRSNVNRSVSRPESNSRPMMDTPQRDYPSPRAESRSMPQREVSESRRVEMRPAEYPSARAQREPAVVRASPPRQSSSSGGSHGSSSSGGGRGQQSHSSGRDSHSR
jgi:Family of unknown function (DUF6600)/FecR protein